MDRWDSEPEEIMESIIRSINELDNDSVVVNPLELPTNAQELLRLFVEYRIFFNRLWLMMAHYYQAVDRLREKVDAVYQSLEEEEITYALAHMMDHVLDRNTGNLSKWVESRQHLEMDWTKKVEQLRRRSPHLDKTYSAGRAMIQEALYHAEIQARKEG